ncbi:hypothetical protein KPH14_010551 [Odynerus spinipes]|uniref:Condensin-2 complex subunit G2 n=1 Tax=Odynerus spinipes TaxID=1348599 RepID=A0AAD9VT44_9HYME|nr:hypothetical protein KPH14_010551 [Odynerus spinipes]
MKGKDASDICKKMKLDVRNITILSEDELCELWHHVKIILLDAQKLSILQSDNEYSKEQQQALKLIHTITAMALETILQRTFVPNVLLEIVIILHSVILQEVKDAKIKDEISYLLENWWKSNMIWKEKVIINVMKHLIEKSEISLHHVKRLYEMKSALHLLKRKEDIKKLVELSQITIIISIKEGRNFLLHLFTLGEEFIMGIHNNVKAALENAESNVIKAYADLYAKAWLDANGKNKKLISTKCFKNIIFHCFRTPRNSTGRVKLGKNLLIFLNALHHSKDSAVKKMLHDHCKTLLWEHLKASGSCVRCNAAEILLIIYPMQSMRLTRNNNGIDLSEQHTAISHLLQDSNQEVCLIAINGTLKILETYWKDIPADIIKNWLNILLCHMKSECSSEIKMSILNGIKQAISNEHSHASLKNFLSNFANEMCYADVEIIKSFTKLLMYLQNRVGIPVWDIVTLTTLLKCVEDTGEIKIVKQLVRLLCLRIQPHDLKHGNITQEIVNMGTKNIAATRKLFFHSKHIIDWNNALRLINTILITIEKQATCLFTDEEESNQYSKRFKKDDNESSNSVQNVYMEEADVYESFSILLDVVAILLYVNKQNFTKEYFDEQEKNLQHVITTVLPQFLCPYSMQKMVLNESTIFLLSFVPLKLMTDTMNVCKTIVEQLSNSNISNDTLITILYTLMKWEKTDMIFESLKESMIKCTTRNMHHDQENDSHLDINEQQNVLTLSVKILKYLLAINSQEELLKIHYQDLLDILKDLRVIQCHMENRLQCENNIMQEQVLIDLFKEYISIICILLKNDIFNISEYFQDVLIWIEVKVIPKIPVVEECEKHQFPINILKIVSDTCNSMMKQCQLSTKMCCKVIVLYFKTLSTSSSIIFINNALSAIDALLDFSKIECDDKNSNLLNIILPNFLSSIMTTLTKFSEDIITVHTDNLKLLSSLIHKYFQIIECTYNDQDMHTMYLTVILNTAVRGISKEIINISRDTSTDIFKIKFPYLTKKLLKFTLYMRRYQDACFCAIKQALIHYDEIDILSTLLIVNKMFKLPVKTIKLQGVMRAIKLEYEKRCNFTTNNRFITDAITATSTLIQSNS